MARWYLCRELGEAIAEREAAYEAAVLRCAALEAERSELLDEAQRGLAMSDSLAALAHRLQVCGVSGPEGKPLGSSF